MLEKRGITHEVLNAKQHTREAEIVAQAGRLQGVTVATNMAGRGVDILLGGNPEILAKRDLAAKDVDIESDEGRAELLALEATYARDTKAEGDKVRELGGLYVLGTERHESRRIDNQLRGRAGRQGDPGESRFYLSLEDDLMRLFATGAINWVMGKALPDDVPLEAKMVSKAIERAQTTVEQKNGEIRKNVLKYDEVMNAQRKVIYALRDQILDEADLREKILTEHLPEAIEALVGTYCVADFHEEWDLDGLHADVLTYWPSSLTKDQLGSVQTTDDLYELLVDDATTHYEKRESELGADVMRQVERQVMLKIIDTKWREHLFEMDYLQEGINLRAMGQKDPLTEWQREGFEMFGMMMKGIAQDLVRYVMHVQVTVQQPTPAPAVGTDFNGAPGVGGDEPRVQNMQYSAPDDPGAGSGMAAAAQRVVSEGGPAAAPAALANQSATMTPVVKSEWDKTPRNAPCPCGSGKKFKLCHGKA
jgi:preprotein translocase subunit SecA